MSFASSLTLADATPTNHVFSTVRVTPDGIDRLDAASTLANPTILAIKHSVTGKGPTAVDRHLVSFAKTETDGNGLQTTAVMNLTVQLPRSGASDGTDVSHLWAMLNAFVAGSGNLAALLRGES